jgi:hypothetical protein
MTDSEQPDGLDSRYCGAKKRQGEGFCKRPAGWGTDHPGVGRCKLHGGKTQTHNHKASIEIARRECNRLGIPVDEDDGDPGELLLAMVREAAGNVEFYRSQVAALTPEPGIDLVLDDEGVPTPTKRNSIYGPTFHATGRPTGEGKPHVLVTLYNEERDKLVSYAQAALRANVEERRVRLDEMEARRLMAGAVKAIQATGLTPEQAEVFRREFAKALRAQEPAALAG